MASPAPETTAQQQQQQQQTFENDESLQVDDAAAPNTDDDIDDGDSALGGDFSESTASITSSILRYRTIHGRTYHSERGNAQYWGSNDEQQSEALDINHHALTLAIGDRLFLSPLETDKIQRVLDVGTGTGIWAIDFADEYPGVEVIGTDISPIQPTWVPPNLKFEIEDCTQEWTFPPAHFDFIHIRGLVGSIDDWDLLYQRAFTALKPGGWLESYEISPKWESDDDTVADDSAMGRWGGVFIEAGKKIGRSFTIVQDEVQRKGMEAAGFVNIQEKNIKQPIGSWPKDKRFKEIGVYSKLVMDRDAEGLMTFMAGLAGWTREDVLVYAAKLKKELRSGKHHSYYKQKSVWGQKPV